MTSATLLVTVLSACGTTEEVGEVFERETSPDCSVFESVHEAYWRAYRSLPSSTTLPPIDSMLPSLEAELKRRGLWTEKMESDPNAPPPRATVIYTQPEDRANKGVRLAQDAVVRAWPLVTDETLRYLMKEMAEAPTRGDWQRNFTSASSYCDLPDQPTASK